MTKSHSAYIALGSNLGDKIKNLQTAIDHIYLKIGNIDIISEIFVTEAVGFKGGEFYNCCLRLQTRLSADDLLTSLLAIESEMGRIRKGQGYESRLIDLDILFYDSIVLSNDQIQIPHPRIQERNFVLQPLNSIGSKFIHPLYKRSIEELIGECTDGSMVKPLKLWLKNPSKRNRFRNYNYVAIEGNIGAGKTSLAKMLANDFNAKLILERFADNPFLPKFYENPQRYAFTLEMSFLADRYRQISDDLSQLDLFKEFVLSDYDVFKSLIFSKITLPIEEYNLYRTLFYQMFKDIPKPDLYVYLLQDTESLLENINKRGRDYETHIDADYLQKINSGYLEYIKNQPNLNIKVVDISNRDFISNREDYIWVLDEISQ